MQESDGDSLTRLMEDVDRAAKSFFCICGYYNNQKSTECATCSIKGNSLSCESRAIEDISHRLHALMPHDRDGREIKAGDTIKSTNAMQMDVTDVIPLPVLTLDDDGTSRVAAAVPHLWRVMEPDSWEKLEADATLGPRDYLTRKDASDKRYGFEAMAAMAADLVARAKALAGAE